jgi:hypothetical protein
MILVTAIFRRPALTASVLRYYAAQPYAHRIAVVSPEDPACESYTPEAFPGWTFVHAPNEPLGHKWNTALKAARLFDPESVMITGSDDLISPAYLKLATNSLREYAYVHPESIYFYVPDSGRCIYAEPFPTGAGRLIRRDVLESVKWKLWPDEQNDRLDGAMDHALRRVTIQRCPYVVAHPIVDIKTDNMWQLEGNAITRGSKRLGIRHVKDVDPAWLFSQFPGFENIERRAA